MPEQNLKETFTIEGVVDRVEKNDSPNPKAPKGFLYLKDDDRKFTIWSKSFLDLLIENGQYKIIYEHSQNEFNGRTYNNYTIKSVVDKNLEVNSDKFTFTKEYINEVKEMGVDTSKLKEGDGIIPWELMGIPIVKDEEVKEIRLPKRIIDYLIELKSKAEFEGNKDE